MSSKTRVTRSLKIRPATIESVSKLLAVVQGIDAIAQTGPNRLRVTYDVTRTGWSVVCQALNEGGVPLPQGTLARWRNRWRDFVEHRMRNNRRSSSSCCG